jgi:hypothetical protein
MYISCIYADVYLYHYCVYQLLCICRATIICIGIITVRVIVYLLNRCGARPEIDKRK